MLLFRWLMLLLIVAAALCGVFYLGTGRAHYKRWSILILKWSVIAGLAFFAIMLLGRMV